MTWSEIPAFFRRGSLFLGTIALISSGLLAGEKIQFDGAGKSELPKEGLKEGTAGATDNILKSNSRENESDFHAIQQRPELPAASKKKIAEYLDKKKNWIFATDSKKESAPSISEMFGVKEPSYDGTEDKPKKVMDAFFEDKKKNNTGGKKEGSNDSKYDAFSRKESRGQDDRRDDSSESGGIAEFNLNRLIHPNENNTLSQVANDSAKPKFEALGSSFNALNSRVPDPDRVKQEEVRSEDFRRLIQPRAARTIGGSIDPINSPDSTRREINPVLGRSADITARFGSPEQREPIRTFAPPPSGPSVFETLGSASGSSLAPAVVAPFTPPPRVEHKPVPVLEFPRRNY